MKRAMIFDFGNVLMKTEDYGPRHRWDERLGLPPGSVEQAVHNAESWVQAQHGRISVETYWQDVALRLGLNAQEINQLASDFYSGDVLDDGLIEMIRELRREGFIVALLSNDSSELEDKLHRLGIHALFDPLVISAHIGVMKPDARAYEAVLTRINHKADTCIFIDDRIENVLGAKAIGMHSIHYQRDMNLRDELQDLLYT